MLLRTAAGVLLLGTSMLLAAEFPDPAVDNKSPAGVGKQTAVLAGGCFWCVEAVFRQIEGVEKAVSGYSGGDAASAHYEIVSTGRTGHAESVQVTYDPRKISYGQILKVFFDVAHDPTQLNRQGPDAGPQYRSVIFYSDPEQKRIAEAYIKQLDQAKVLRSSEREVTGVADVEIRSSDCWQGEPRRRCNAPHYGGRKHDTAPDSCRALRSVS